MAARRRRTSAPPAIWSIMANARGGHDNVTVVLVRAHEGVAPSRMPLGARAATEEIPAYGPTKTLSIPVAAPLEPVPATQVSPGASSAAPPAAHAPGDQDAGGRAAAAASRGERRSMRARPVRRACACRLRSAFPRRLLDVEHATPRVSRVLVALVVVVALARSRWRRRSSSTCTSTTASGSHHDGTADGGSAVARSRRSSACPGVSRPARTSTRVPAPRRW